MWWKWWRICGLRVVSSLWGCFQGLGLSGAEIKDWRRFSSGGFYYLKLDTSCEIDHGTHQYYYESGSVVDGASGEKIYDVAGDESRHTESHSSPDSLFSIIAIFSWKLWLEENSTSCVNLPMTSKQMASLIELITLKPIVPIDISITKLQKETDLYKQLLSVSTSLLLQDISHTVRFVKFVFSLSKAQIRYCSILEFVKIARKSLSWRKHLDLQATCVVWFVHSSSVLISWKGFPSQKNRNLWKVKPLKQLRH